MTLDLTRPLMLRDGTRLVLDGDVDTTTFKRPSISVGLNVPDQSRRAPDLFLWNGIRNKRRSFFLDDGKHVFGSTNDQVVNVIDWDRPIELDDGTPLKGKLSGDGYHFDIELVWASYRHSAFPIGGRKGSAQLSTGLVLSNHKFHVRNRTMLKKIDTTKPMVFIVPTGETPIDANFITVTSEGHILVQAKQEIAGWYIFTADGLFVRSEHGAGTGCKLANKVERFVGYQCVGQVTKAYIMASTYQTEAEARRLGKQVVRVTSEDGRVISVELLA